MLHLFASGVEDVTYDTQVDCGLVQQLNNTSN